MLVIDNNRSKDGIFFIDASNLGYKDEDSKIRLREQDIKRIIDAWYERKDKPYFSHLATYETTQNEGEDKPMYEIERKNFALNLSLYVTPIDKEIHQSIDAHLHGGIPTADVERLNKYWSVCTTLQSALFKPFREEHVALAISQDKVTSTIEQDTSFRKQVNTYEKAIKEWMKEIEPYMLSVDKDNDPKSLIADWGQKILDKFLACPSLVDAYDVYDQLLIYYAKTLQDDLFMISRDGWLATLIQPTKRNPKHTDLQCDLLPVSIAVEHFHSEIKKQLDEKEDRLAIKQSEKDALLEDIDEENGDEKENTRIKKDVAALDKEIRTLKADIKKLDKELYEKLVKTYAELTPESIKLIVVREKWLADVKDRISREMEKVTHVISTEVIALHRRYEHTLPEIQKLYSDKEKIVKQHLAKMGFTFE